MLGARLPSFDIWYFPGDRCHRGYRPQGNSESTAFADKAVGAFRNDGIPFRFSAAILV